MKVFLPLRPIAFAFLSLLAGFSLRAEDSPPPAPSEPVPARSSTSELRPGDRLKFSVREDPNLSAEVVVGADGSVDLPLIGQCAAAGKTISQFTLTAKQALEKEYLVEASVRVVLMERPERSTKRGRVYLAGRMRKIGAVEIDLSEPNTLGRVVLANGGLTEIADAKRVRVIRRSANSEALETITVDLDEILQKGRIDKDITLVDGDFIIADAKLVNW